jgi:hypothetical protein
MTDPQPFLSYHALLFYHVLLPWTHQRDQKPEKFEMPALQNGPPPPYAAQTQDAHLDIPPHASPPTTAKGHAHVHPPATTPDPSMPRQTWRERRQRLRNNAAKALALGAGAIALTVAVRIVLVVDVACEGVKIVIQIVAAPLVLCVLCVSTDDFDS